MHFEPGTLNFERPTFPNDHGFGKIDKIEMGDPGDDPGDRPVSESRD